MGVLDRIISNLNQLKRNKDLLLFNAAQKKENEIADINRMQLSEGEMVDESPITWGRDTKKYTTYQDNKKNQSKSRVGNKITLFDTGDLYNNIITESTAKGIKVVNNTSKGDLVAKYYNGTTNYLGIQKNNYSKLRLLLISDIKKQIANGIRLR